MQMNSIQILPKIKCNRISAPNENKEEQTFSSLVMKSFKLQTCLPSATLQRNKSLEASFNHEGTQKMNSYDQNGLKTPQMILSSNKLLENNRVSI